ncbi:FMN-dependent NADH-azoreductase 1 [Capnocytophaga sp. HP1101]
MEKKKILIINCHPLYHNSEATTVKLAHYAHYLLGLHADVEIEPLELYNPNCFLPRVDEQMYAAWFSQTPTEEQQRIAARQNELIEQFIAADYVFIFSPLHNFNVTSKFKDYVDNIFIAKRTFKYTADGSVGLLSNNKKVVYVQVSGSEYEEDFRYIPMDLASRYVRSVLSMMGITKMKLIRAQGMDIAGADREAIVKEAQSEIAQYISKMSLSLKS